MIGNGFKYTIMAEAIAEECMKISITSLAYFKQAVKNEKWRIGFSKRYYIFDAPRRRSRRDGQTNQNLK